MHNVQMADSIGTLYVDAAAQEEEDQRVIA